MGAEREVESLLIVEGLPGGVPFPSETGGRNNPLRTGARTSIATESKHHSVSERKPAAPIFSKGVIARQRRVGSPDLRMLLSFTGRVNGGFDCGSPVSTFPSTRTINRRLRSFIHRGQENEVDPRPQIASTGGSITWWETREKINEP
jgi:hypothetical protein